MMAAPSKPSTSGYTPVPTQERIDDDVESPQNDDDVSEDELYTTSAPLLSNRSRGNETPQAQNKLCWYHKIAALNPLSRKRTTTPAWQPPLKPRSWRRIIIVSFCVFAVAAITGLSISTGVIATQLNQCRSSSRSWYPRYRNPMTRLPLNNWWLSANNRLNFVEVYPPLESSASPACQAAWRAQRYVPCHEKIWNRSWDNGKRASIFDPDVGLYAESMCTPQCMVTINNAMQLVSSQCTEDDKFNMTNYRGPFIADPGLEAGPLSVVSTIAKRVSHTCRIDPDPQETPRYYWTPPGYCSAILWEDWQIVDGMNAGNLEGLSSFDRLTERSRIEHRQRREHLVQNDECDNINYSNARMVGQRSFGPSKNETTCGWCVMNWFERKLSAWEEGKIVDPETGKIVGLKEYLQRIKKMGERCDTEAWEKTWNRATRKYKGEKGIVDPVTTEPKDQDEEDLLEWVVVVEGAGDA
ncbi:hypothetical protein BU24DRAFT_428279 [Aaosphaeria arxii CBS 175.79]|uniref:Uncharacterized protein n=1 Tax=Aaosphaeria arxii CBS 175.79 TaxID=1450172 RepID=A0A6A5X8W7_9PLEO|nr:uncharacterized protein BU24DRAFT_428279 [Aaosphaeria arxii CBS 175.79]KAF2009371.1 hypothetical protein BU24DRAFT_428279 [Aaosphaeria arxii CBS 175.79]